VNNHLISYGYIYLCILIIILIIDIDINRVNNCRYVLMF